MTKTVYTVRVRRRWIAWALAVAAMALILPGLDSRLTLRRYEVFSGKLTSPVRLALITDFHSCDYGPGQTELMDSVRDARPDLVLLGGDIIDDGIPPDHALELLENLASDYPCYYVTGNHEFWSGKAEAYKNILREMGITVLEGNRVTVEIQGQQLDLCGVDDPAVGEEIWKEQLATCAAGTGERYTVLLTHRPERVEDYQGGSFDLTLAGHAHGGQWRIPGLLNGLVAPNQGIFPDHAGGRYELSGTVLIVSRGLARESTRVPRFYNRPELVLVDLTPEAALAE